MAATLELAPAGSVAPSPEPARPWRLAFLAPAVVAAPWLVLAVGAGLPAGVATAGGAVLVLLMIVTTVTDLRRRRIYNWATYTAGAWAFGLHLVAAAVPADWVVRLPGPFAGEPVAVRDLLVGITVADAAGGFAIGFGVMLLLYGVFQGGAGDVKLVAALGALVGGNLILHVIAYGYVIAAVAGACYLVWVAGPVGLIRELGVGLGLCRRPPGGEPLLARKIPMAPFLNAGAVLALFW